MLLHTLGELKLEGSDLTSPKPLLLLAYLALEGPKDRRFLAELFWMGTTDPLNRLSTTLTKLRRTAPGVFGADNVRVWAEVKTDAQQLLSAVEAGEDEEVLSLYGGPFLEGVYLPDWGEELEEWVYQTREYLAERVRSILLKLAEKEASQARFDSAAKRAETAYKLAGASVPEPEELPRFYTLMLAGGSPYAAEVREEVSGFDLDLVRSPKEARERLQTELSATPQPSSPTFLTATFTSRRMEQQIRFCTSKNGVRIAYATVGEGPVLVKAANWLSHLDFDWNSPVWRHWLGALSRSHTLIRYDERGCGLSDWDTDDFSLDAWVRDLETVVDTIGCKRFPLLGISQGGAVAIAYAVRHPEKVSHLILYGAYALGGLKRNLSERQRQREEADTLIKLIRLGWGQENPAFRQVFTTLFIPEGTMEQIRWFNDLQRISTSPENAEKFVRSFNTLYVSDLAPKVAIPTLVLHAKDDARVPFEEGRLLATLIPNARFVPLESKNHILLEHEPAWQRFVTEVYEFLGVSDLGGQETLSTSSDLERGHLSDTKASRGRLLN